MKYEEAIQYMLKGRIVKSIQTKAKYRYIPEGLYGLYTQGIYLWTGSDGVRWRKILQDVHLVNDDYEEVNPYYDFYDVWDYSHLIIPEEQIMYEESIKSCEDEMIMDYLNEIIKYGV